MSAQVMPVASVKLTGSDIRYLVALGGDSNFCLDTLRPEFPSLPCHKSTIYVTCHRPYAGISRRLRLLVARASRNCVGAPVTMATAASQPAVPSRMSVAVLISSSATA